LLGARGLAAGGLLAACRGDEAQARALLDGVVALEEGAAPAIAQRLAASWLAAEAAERGDWARVEALCERSSRRSAATRFLGHAAVRLRDRDWPTSDGKLYWWWLCSGRWVALWPLLRRALAVPLDRMEEAQKPESIEPPPSGDRVADALRLHALVLGRGAEQLRAEDLGCLGRAWDEARRDPALRRHAAERALVLGAPSSQSGERAIERVVHAAEEDLAAVARAAGIALSCVEPAGETVEAAARRLRNELLSALELASGAVRRRVEELRELPALDEWREWTALRRQAEEAARLGGLSLRRLAFPTLHSDLCKWAVWLWNVRRERVVAHAIFTWLLDEARAVGDQSAVELQEKNTRCGA
jgi:hypothetical protein